MADYMDKLPIMPGDVWFTVPNATFDLGWINGLYKVSNKSIDQFFGGFDYQLDEDDPLDLSDLENFADKGKGALIYASIWIAAAAIFTIAGIIWCLCNKCICCCRSSFKGRGDSEMDNLQNTDPHFELRPRYSERKGKNGKPSSGAIVVSVLMGIWLLSLLLMILLTFGANEKTREAINEVQPDLDNGLKDVLTYLNITINQLTYTFGDSYVDFERKVKVDPFDVCQNDANVPVTCDELSENVNTTMDGTGDDGVDDDLVKDLEELIKALTDVSNEAKSAKTELDENVEDVLKDVNNGLYWIFMLFNLLYLAVFVLVLLGTVLAIFAKQSGLKTAGYLMMRVAIVLIFLMGIFVVAQLVLMFMVGGVIRVVCPAVRGLENEPTSLTIKELHPSSGGERFQDEDYEIPSIGKIIRSCKADDSAYNAFDLSKAFDLTRLDTINDKFKNLIPPTGSVVTASNNQSNSHINQDTRNPQETAEEVQRQVGIYTKFIQDAVRNNVGNCKPTYHALNATINLFCEKVSAPLIGFWWILQFIAVVFVLIIVTVMVFERLHF